MNKRTINNIGLISFLLIFVLLVIRNEYRLKSLMHNSKFTIGLVTSVEVLSRGGYSIYYKYSVSKKIYINWNIIDKNMKSLIGKRFYVRFDSTDHRQCLIILEMPVSDKIRSAPVEGWKKIPE